jgi:hypothetical protein
VYIWNQSTDPGAANANRTDPVIAVMQLDNGVQVFLRERETPADIREYVEFKTQQEMGRLRKMMIDENFHPTTEPTTQPAEPG